MPELPEVEHTARQLRTTVIDATIREAQVFWEPTIGHPSLSDFLMQVAERRIIGVRRRGKFLLLDLQGTERPDVILTIHRRMTGNLLILPAGWEIDTSMQEINPVNWSTKGPSFRQAEGDTVASLDLSLLSYCRVCLNLADGRRLLFTDPRKFGRIELWPREIEERALAGLGPEPLSEEFTVKRLVEALSGRKSTIKQLLLAQEVVAAIGNIYADE